NGAITGVTLTRATNGTFGGSNSAATTGGYESLEDDYQTIASEKMAVTFNNLAAGDYVIFSYGAPTTSSANLSTVNMTGTQEYCQATQYIGGTTPVNAFKPGITH